MHYLTLPLLLAPLAAQRTWIVDAAGGSGVHFLDIPPAIAAATDGDTIAVRGATTSYQLVELTKGVRIVGMATGQGRPKLAPATMVSVLNIGAGKTLVFAGFVLEEPSVRIVDCGGTVVLRDLTSWASTRTPSYGISISRAAAVSLHQVDLVHGVGWMTRSPAAVVVADSTVYCSNCSFIAPDLFLPWQHPAVGLLAGNSQVTLTGCTVVGGRLHGEVDVAPAILVRSGVTVLIGGTTVIGGGGVAIDGVSRLVRDPLSVVHGSIGGGIHVVAAQIPVSLATPRWTGDYLDVGCRAQPGDVVIQGVGQLQPAVPGPFGVTWLDPARMILLDVGVVPADGFRSARPVRLPVPGAFTGLTLALQSLVLRGRTLSWSIPAAFVVE